MAPRTPSIKGNDAGNFLQICNSKHQKRRFRPLALRSPPSVKRAQCAPRRAMQCPQLRHRQYARVQALVAGWDASHRPKLINQRGGVVGSARSAVARKAHAWIRQCRGQQAQAWPLSVFKNFQNYYHIDSTLCNIHEGQWRICPPATAADFPTSAACRHCARQAASAARCATGSAPGSSGYGPGSACPWRRTGAGWRPGRIQAAGSAPQ